MASLKSFLSGVAPILEVTPAALYERQRALVSLGILTPIEGRGRGSGVPFTAENFAAVLISLLATDSLSEVNESVVALCKAIPDGSLPLGRNRAEWEIVGKPTFLSDVARVLAGKNTAWRGLKSSRVHAIRVSRPCVGKISRTPTGATSIDYEPTNRDSLWASRGPIRVSASIEEETLSALFAYTRGALSLLADEEDDE